MTAGFAFGQIAGPLCVGYKSGVTHALDRLCRVARAERGRSLPERRENMNDRMPPLSFEDMTAAQRKAAMRAEMIGMMNSLCAHRATARVSHPLMRRIRRAQRTSLAWHRAINGRAYVRGSHVLERKRWHAGHSCFSPFKVKSGRAQREQHGRGPISAWVTPLL